MARNAGSARIGPSHRRVLKLLARAPEGRADRRFIARYTVELLNLIDVGFVEAQAATIRQRGRTIETARVRITAAGRRAIKA
jgi:hypothetical protein